MRRVSFPRSWDRWRSWPPRLLVGALSTALAVRLALGATFVTCILFSRGDITYPEGALVYAAERVARGQPLYQDFRTLPHVFVPYGPCYFWLAGMADRWGGTTPFGSYLACRLVTLSAFLLVIVLLAVWARELTGSTPKALLLAALAAACPVFWGAVVSSRSDTLALAASLGCAWVAARPWGSWRWPLAWTLAVVAWSSKQSYVAVGPAVALAVFQAAGAVPAACWAAAWLAGIGLVALALDRLTGGMATLNMFATLAKPLDPAGALAIVRQIAPFVAVVFAAALRFLLPATRHTPHRLPAWWFLFAALAAAGSVLVEGAGANYFLEAWIAGCLVLAATFQARLTGTATAPVRPGQRGSDPVRRVGLWVLLVALTAGHDVVHSAGSVTRELVKTLWMPPHIRATGGMPELIPMLASYRGEVFVQRPYLNIAARRAPVVLDVLQYRQMVDRGLVSARPLVERIAAGRYGLIVLAEPIGEAYDERKFLRWPRAVWSAMKQHYELLGTVDGQQLYVPQGRAPVGDVRRRAAGFTPAGPEHGHPAGINPAARLER